MSETITLTKEEFQKIMERLETLEKAQERLESLEKAQAAWAAEKAEMEKELKQYKLLADVHKKWREYKRLNTKEEKEKKRKEIGQRIAAAKEEGILLVS